MKRVILALIIVLPPMSFGQVANDQGAIKQIFDEALLRGKSYEMLHYLCKNIGHRLSGSPSAAAAVEWTRHVMEDYGFDSVFLQPIMVPHWFRGQAEIGRVVNSRKLGTVEMNVCALGGSIGTGPSGIVAKVVEVKSFEELKALGKQVQNKIVFFNRPLDPTQINTFSAYGGAVNQRGSGAVEAARLGALAVIVRSMGSNLEDYPHTGGMRYEEGVNKIPAVAVATRHAELLSKLLKEDKDLEFYIESHCQTLEDAPSFNVIGEIRGSEYPDQYIVVGGHLDSWDLGEGAHDDGAGCVQSIEVLRLFKAIGYKPRYSIRAVMFMNEENGLRGGLKYAEIARQRNERHLAAIESDRGGFTPRGFSIGGEARVLERILGWKPYLEPYGLAELTKGGGGGADIGPLGSQSLALIGYVPDSQRYFDYHHTAEDTFDKVNKRELELGAASMAALVYLIDRYGLE